MNLRDYERESIRAFVEKAGTLGYLKGRVLDYGCGKQPYRSLVESFGAEYHGFDRASFPGNVGGVDYGGTDESVPPIDTILCTQVLQYIHHPDGLLSRMPRLFQHLGGYLVMTYPTNWPEVEAEDLHRFTKAGMERLLTEAGFEIVLHQARGSVWDPQFETSPMKRVRATGEEFVLGYGCVARA